MALYAVSYDLRREVTAQDYDRLYEALRSYSGWCWPLESIWIIDTDFLPSAIIKGLLNIGIIDDNDGIIILELTGRGNYRRASNKTGVVEWLNNTLTRI
ncbi:hypothetical protein [Paracoccus aminovorans]|uniref:hypothetical protein n=1 Tax=Paracoccus aminovorans TaxID=34004 RepID=UPI000781B655|nr:hypothetical protein [Paracoccus aminovorans]